MEPRIRAYTALASAVGAASASADIVYHEVNTTIGLGDSIQFLVGTEVGLSAYMSFIGDTSLIDGIDNSNSGWLVMDYGYGQNYIDFAAGFSFTAGYYASLWRFGSSVQVDSNLFLPGTSIALGFSWNGQPSEPERGFAAFKLSEFADREGPAYYGWIDITWSNDGFLTIHGYAWNDTANAAIHVGDVPAPGALGLLGLAAGAAGIRRKRTA